VGDLVILLVNYEGDLLIHRVNYVGDLLLILRVCYVDLGFSLLQFYFYKSCFLLRVCYVKDLLFLICLGFSLLRSYFYKSCCLLGVYYMEACVVSPVSHPVQCSQWVHPAVLPRHHLVGQVLLVGQVYLLFLICHLVLVAVPGIPILYLVRLNISRRLR